MQKTFNEFATLYKADEKLTVAVTPDMEGKDMKERVQMAALTMIVHSLLNLELVKVRR
jgi:hypothetical protein